MGNWELVWPTVIRQNIAVLNLTSMDHGPGALQEEEEELISLVPGGRGQREGSTFT